MLFLIVLAVLSAFYVGLPDGDEPTTFSSRLEDVRNAGLAIGGLVGAVILFWRASSHKIQARAVQQDQSQKLEEFNKDQLSQALKGLLSDEKAERMAVLDIDGKALG
ncbi:MAG: hypothetical protein AAFO69_20665 [Bacteroidota bacterium]